MNTQAPVPKGDEKASEPAKAGSLDPVRKPMPNGKKPFPRPAEVKDEPGRPPRPNAKIKKK